MTRYITETPKRVLLFILKTCRKLKFSRVRNSYFSLRLLSSLSFPHWAVYGSHLIKLCTKSLNSDSCSVLTLLQSHLRHSAFWRDDSCLHLRSAGYSVKMKGDRTVPCGAAELLASCSGEHHHICINQDMCGSWVFLLRYGLKVLWLNNSNKCRGSEKNKFHGKFI